MKTSCNDCRIQHIEDAVYRQHEIVISRCPTCEHFIVDARSDGYDGEFLSGYIDTSIYNALTKAMRDIDQHIIDMQLTANLPY